MLVRYGLNEQARHTQKWPDMNDALQITLGRGQGYCIKVPVLRGLVSTCYWLRPHL